MIFFKEYSVYSIWSFLPYSLNMFRAPLRIECCCWSDRRRIAGGNVSCGEQPWIQMKIPPLHRHSLPPPSAACPSSWQARDWDQSMALELGTPGGCSVLYPGQCTQSYLRQPLELSPLTAVKTAPLVVSAPVPSFFHHSCCACTLSDFLSCFSGCSLLDYRTLPVASLWFQALVCSWMGASLESCTLPSF